MTEIIEKRIKTLKSVLPNKKDQDAVEKDFLASNGDWTAASASLKAKLPEETFKKVSFAHSLADWSNDHIEMVKALAEQPDLASMHDVALRYNTDKLAAIVSPENVPEGTPGATADEKKKNFAVTLYHKLFSIEPTAMLQRMVNESEIPIADASMSKGVANVLNNLPDFNIRTTSIYKAFKQPDAFKGIADEQRAGVMQKLKHLSLLTAISPVPEAVPVLMKANLTSAYHVAEMPESTFLKKYSSNLGEGTARQVYTNAINSRIRNEHALMTMRETIRGTGLAAIDGKKKMKDRMVEAQAVVDNSDIPIDLENLFGSMDFCECDECCSVYSPASYYVELLQYLRNNDLDLDPAKVKTDPKDITNTLLEKLFLRRPDLGDLELTCQNTNTVMPYIDLVNEVMESFVLHLDEYQTEQSGQKQVILDAYNITDETTEELLAQPQNTKYKAYCTLKNAVYPLTLPYHQPIDVIRIWLKYMGTSRYELLDTFRTANETCTNAGFTAAQLNQLQTLHTKVLNRSADAEFLGITQEEYIILTRKAFWPKKYFELTLQQSLDVAEYQKEIGVREVWEYYGYPKDGGDQDMLSTDEDPKKQIGLTFVKKQFLPRTGIQYVDLVDLLKTQFINSVLPEGKALAIMESIRFSYKFLKTKVHSQEKDPTKKFSELIDYLNNHPPSVSNICLKSKDLSNWVYCYFDRIGKLIVLDSSEEPQLPFEGNLFLKSYNGSPTIEPHVIIEGPVGFLHKNGTVDDKNSVLIGNVNLKGHVDPKDPNNLVINLWVEDENGKHLGYIGNDGNLYGMDNKIVSWIAPQDTCNLDNVRMKHLDDDIPLDPEDYDRMQRFIRLWRKLGWTIDETDKALIGLSPDLSSNSGDGTTTPSDCNFVKFDAFQDNCIEDNGGDDGGCPDGNGDDNCPEPNVPINISPDFLHQLVDVRKVIDLTGLSLEKLLTFWAPISTSGENSLYARLFLTHNLLGIDKIFEPDTNGNYLAKQAKISEHMPVLMAALNMKSDDVNTVINLKNLSDELTLDNVSVLYRYSLLVKILHVRYTDMAEVFALFGDPFTNAQNTLDLFLDWGTGEDAGFTFHQLDYIIRDTDDELHPLAPKERTKLQITKTLYNGLNAIDQEHPDIGNKDEATADLIRAKAGLLYEQSVVEQIIGLLEGTTVYTADAPANQAVKIPDDLAKKFKYTNQKDATSTAFIQVTGILTDAETTQAKALSNNPEWAKAVDCLRTQAVNFFNDVLTGIFPNTDEAKGKLLTGDINLSPDPQNPNAIDLNTAPVKRLYFLQNFLPFLRQRLAHRLIISTMADSAGLANDITDFLLSDVLLVGTGQHAIDALQQIHLQPATGGNGWDGYLIPPADDMYTFIAKSEKKPASLKIDGASYDFLYQQDCPSYFWSTDPVKLKAGKLYRLETSIQDLSQLQWKTATSPKATIPSSALLPDYSTKGTEDAFIKLYKAALLVNGFNLSIDETNYWQNHPDDFDGFNFNAVTLQHWRRLQAYTALRDKLPKTNVSLLNLFAWASKPDDASKLSEHIATVTLWKQDYIEKLIAPEHFDLNNPQKFRNEINLAKLQKAQKVSDAIGTDIDQLFEWANPSSKFWVCHHIAESIQKTLRSRYDQEDWEQVVKPLNDQLREDQKQALINYLLVQQDLIDWGVIDADSLFEFFLIDVQMGACMETSRIKQAISSVQSFIQRCLLGLEENYGIAVDLPDRKLWDWMQKYRVWEANREVFLYPENWIVSELRDDKSQFYKDLESELLQKDINTQTVTDALNNYLFKVDEVANLKVCGLFKEPALKEDGTPQTNNGKIDYIKLHVFSRTRNAPFFFYYRYFDNNELNWYPWEKVQVDIPSYDFEDPTGQITKNGTYLIPVVWNNRLLIFFPQFMKKTIAPAINPITVSPGTDKQGSTDGTLKVPVDQSKPSVKWEIKMGWSEYRNGKWTQKQVSSEAVYDTNSDPTILPDIFLYKFVPRIYDTDPRVVIEIRDQNGNTLGAFDFTGSQLSKESSPVGTNFDNAYTEFHYIKETDIPYPQIHSLQATDDEKPSLFGSNVEPYFEDRITSVKVFDISFDRNNFYHSFVHELLGKLSAGNLDDLFNYYLTSFSKDSGDKDEAFGGFTQQDNAKIYNELRDPYSLYNWEAGFHAPMLLVDRLYKSLQFDQSLKMCNYIFNPLTEEVGDETRCWQFPPFRIHAKDVLENLFLNLQPNTPDKTGQINEWRNNPFEPHAIARLRPSAYMKWVVMKYIEILIDYGDYYFRQNTLETIPMAIQCYVLAAHLYGPSGQKIPKRGKIQPQTYMTLVDKWDAFSNAMVEMELVFPFSNQTSWPEDNNEKVGLVNIFGFASSLYFCIPDNPNIRSLRDTIDDRLFKIRHCEDIEGVFRILPLFEPPIEPGLLVQAAAQGLSLSSVLNDLNSPMPNYRFNYLLQKALELCSELKALGNSFLSVKEKGDAEALSRLRAKHESSIQNLVMEVRKQQLDEAQQSHDALQQSRKGPVSRMLYYLNLVGEDTGKVPDENTDLSELPNHYEQLVDESGLKLIPYEKEEMDKANESADLQIAIGAVETLGSILHLIPDLCGEAEPMGVGAAISFGGRNLGNAAQATARGMQIQAGHLSHQSTSASRKSSFLRQMQDRIQQANNAGYEIKNIDKQILAQNIRINIAQQEITNQQKQIDNAQEVEEYLLNKYTSQELYSWMEGSIRTLYYQAYTLAYDLAKKTEKVYRFERGLTTSNFIQFGYWDAGHDGLLAGEQLYLGLKQLEAAYQEKRGYDYEITKHISLRQVNPLALLELKENGICEFALPEVLFDMDHPGHYMRRIKSVALTVPCVVGPYTSLNCTLQLLEHKFRINAIAKDKNDYLEKTDGTEDRFSTVNVPITSIAVSSGQNDSGVFELNFRDERYIPFEGAGAISKWQIELPTDFRQFDYDTISDVILHLRYTTVEGGDKLKTAAAASVQEYIKSVEDLSQQEGLFAAFDLKHEFPDEWYKANNPPADVTERVLNLNNLNERLPIFTKGRKVNATDVYLISSTNLQSSTLVLTHETDTYNFSDALPIGTMKSFVSTGIECLISNWQLKIQDVKIELDNLWLIVRYEM